MSELHNGWHVVTREWRLGISLRCHIPHNMLIGNSSKRNRLIFFLVYVYTFKFKFMFFLFTRPLRWRVSDTAGCHATCLLITPGPRHGDVSWHSWQPDRAATLYIWYWRVFTGSLGGAGRQNKAADVSEMSKTPTPLTLSSCTLPIGHMAYSLKKDKCRENGGRGKWCPQFSR